GDDLGGGLQFGTLGLLRFELDEAGVGRQGGVDRDLLHGGGAGRADSGEGGQAGGGDQGRSGRGFHGDDGVAGVDRAIEAGRAVHGHDVGDLLGAELGGHARQEVLAEGGAGGQDVGI